MSTRLAIDAAIAGRLTSASSNHSQGSGASSQYEPIPCGIPVLSSHFFPGEVIEISGPSWSGKTQLLYTIVTHILCEYAEQEKGVVVYWVGCNGGFNGKRLGEVVDGINVCGKNGRDANWWKKKIVVLRCWSSVELMATLRQIGDSGYGRAGNDGSVLKVVAIDKIGVWHWAERLSKGERELDCVERGFVTVLRGILKMGRTVAICVKEDLVGDDKVLMDSRGRLKEVERWIEGSEFMPKAWSALASHRVMLFEDERGRRRATVITGRGTGKAIDKSRQLVVDVGFVIGGKGVMFSA